MQFKLVESIAEATGLKVQQIAKVLVRTKDSAFGDFAFPCFMAGKAMGASPQESAQKLAESIRLPEGVSKVEAVGPYVYFFCDTVALAKSLISEALS